MDGVTLSTLIITATTSIVGIITALHLRKVQLCCCIKSECSKSPPPTPTIIEEEPIRETNV